jgi:hypothetical protein
VTVATESLREMGDDALLAQYERVPAVDRDTHAGVARWARQRDRALWDEIARRAAFPDHGFFPGRLTERFRKIAGLPPLRVWDGVHQPLTGMLGTRCGRATVCQLCGQAWPCPASEDQ